ncbi:MAG TPA: hypothetical protein VGB18_03700 [Candidatus Thermoplasmatota archaeon]
MVSDPFLVGVFFGFVPSMGFLYILLHNYEGLFNDKRAFFAYLIGLGAGLIATIFQMFLGPSGAETPTVAFLEILLFGVVHALLFAMALNSKRFRGKRDTPFYGVAFGLGFGALNVLFLVGNAVAQLARTPGPVLVETLSLSYIGLYFMGSILLHAAVGAWIGKGSATRSIFQPLLKSAAAEAIFLGGFYLLFLEPWGSFVPIVGLSLAIALIAHVLKHDLDTIIPPEVRHEMEIHQRRLARQSMLEATGSSGTDPAEARTTAAAPEAPKPLDPQDR